MRTRWDIFCHVVDNYGDAGVCWRLARQLAAEFDADVRLWVDDIETFNRLCASDHGGISPAAANEIDGVLVHYWSAQWQPMAPADVVIEAFGCALPPTYIAAMAAQNLQTLWLNLEYLSAEDWVAGCHGLPSPQANGLQKYFFFPGFSPATGGLLREASLLQTRREFQRDGVAKTQFLSRIAVQPAPDASLVSLFCYENSALASWLTAISEAERQHHILVPEGRVTKEVCAWLGLDSYTLGECYVRGRVCLQFIPFLSQHDYDRLLWCCDFNVVRGEDSFVRAQWAGRPMLWHIYPQQEGAHLVKLAAFLNLYSADLCADEKAVLMRRWQSWNSAEAPAVAGDQLFAGGLGAVRHAEQWCTSLEKQNNLAELLVQFYRNWV